METLKLSLPAMYGDHHVVEVKRILSGQPGVIDLYASSCFQMVEIRFDPGLVQPETLKTALDEAGYLGEIPVPVEAGTTEGEDTRDRSQFRHSIAYEQTGKTVSFARDVPFNGRALWPCPGLGVMKQEKEA
ncbi:MAG: heavy-metal-associated domain-containing protein [Anaerolineales bacterium]|nr:heavy-metal-associated domain-containing protein [Anaerolineales bacterium]